jgi:membrane protein involved in colicin uptake
MVSIKDYARRNNVTYEAVRKQIVRYQSDLEGHITKVNRTQYLDNEAVAFLDTKRSESPIIIVEQNKDAEIDHLKQEKEGLLVKVADQANKIAELSEWKANNSLLIAEAKNHKFLIKASEERADREAAARADAEERARSEAARAAEFEARIVALEGENEAVKKENEVLANRGVWELIKQIFARIFKRRR